MNFALAISLVAFVVGAVVALLSLGFGSAPGGRQYRAFAAVAITAALFCVVDGLATAGLSDVLLKRLVRVQGIVAALHVASWHWYAHRQLGTLQTAAHDRRRRLVKGVLAVTGALWLIPGALYNEALVTIDVPRLGVVYRIPDFNTLGSVVYAVQVGILGVPLVAYLRAWRQGSRDAAVHSVAILAIVAAAVHDTFASTGMLTSPLLLPLGFLISVGPIGWLLTRAFVQNTRALQDLSRRLEHDVATRTNALVSAEAALLRAEKMAALGQLAAGVAHEINNPAAAVAANVAYIRDEIALGKVPPDAVECLDETLEAVDRIASIVRQLLDSGRAAAEESRVRSVTSVLAAVRRAMALSRPSLPGNVATTIAIPDHLQVAAPESPLVQVLVNLIVNGGQAIPGDRPSGTIAIEASTEGARISLVVRDDGTGMSKDTQRRLFEPFFTTKAHGQGTGLGLSVSRGLMQAMGGDLLVTSSPAGTAMTLVLPVASTVT